MSVQRLSGWFAAAALASAVVSAQVQAQQPPQSGDQKADAPKSSITVAGCVAKETDVLKKSAPAGMDDEFVLTRSVLNPPPAKTTKTPEAPAARPDEPIGTSGSANPFGKVYRVTGDNENDLKSYVGKRVEITGSFKHDADAKREMAPSGTSGAAAVELTVENTPEITIAAIRPAAGSCR